MNKKTTYLLVFFLTIFSTQLFPSNTTSSLLTGAEQTNLYYKILQNKNIGVVANQTSTIGNIHLVDSLTNAGFSLKKIFCPEHGFRGEAEAGKHIENNTDKKTGIPIVSLYGNNKKPSKETLEGLDIIIFDIQDVGARFYTYISTMHYVMEACAESNIEFMVLDRPNPNGFYVDGPVLDLEYKSFVGMHPVPVVHGMTIAEYARMVNGEGWLNNKVKCKLITIPIKNYDHNTYYTLPIAPSPNLNSQEAIYLYPSLCFFEGTDVSIGRGTKKPFTVVGHPLFDSTGFIFTPVSIKGKSNYPKHENKICHGYDLTKFANIITKRNRQLSLSWIITNYKQLHKETKFFNDFFTKLAGNKILQQQIIDGLDEKTIRLSWQKDLMVFKKIRNKYLMYKDFN